MDYEKKLEIDAESFLQRRKVDIFILIIGTILGIYFDWSIIEIIIFLTFIWSLLGPISSRILAVVALFFLTFTPILHFLQRLDRAEEFAIYAYYFLVMAVIRAVIEIRAEKEPSGREGA